MIPPPASSKKKVKILFIVNVDWFFVSHRLPIAISAIESGYDVHLACQYTQYKTKLQNLGITTHELFLSRKPSAYLHLLIGYLQVFHLLMIHRPDIVHLITLPAILLGGVSSKLLNIRSVVYSVPGLGHGFSDQTQLQKLRKKLITKILSTSLSHPRKTVIVQNKSNYAFLTEEANIHQNEIKLILGSGVDLKLYKSTPLPTNNIPCVLFASRLLKTKGVFEFVSAAKAIRKLGIKANFIVVGKPDPSNPASITTEELRTIQDEGHVQLCGFSPSIVQSLRSSSLLVLPSTYHEGLPKVLCEAAASGRPSITTNLPGCRDAVIDGITGLVVEPRDQEQLISAISLLIMNKTLAQEMGKNARRHAEKSFSIIQVVQKHLDIYQLHLDSFSE